MPRLLVFGNPENRRVAMLQRASDDCGWSMRCVAYENLLRDRVDLSTCSRDYDAVRFESPGENFAVERLLLQWGASLAEQENGAYLPARAAARLEYELGRIHFPRQYYFGFKVLMEQCTKVLGNVVYMNHPQDILCMWDKQKTIERLARNSIPTPPAIGLIQGPDQLFEEMHTRNWQRVFVKIVNGSSASGVAAITVRDSHFQAVTTVEIVESNGESLLYNSLKPRVLRGHEAVSQLIGLLAPHRLYGEKWLPKAAASHDRVMDLRVVVIAGEPSHFVVRTSRTPLTNLHLGNQRGDIEQLRSRLGESGQERLNSLCRSIASVFPDSHYAGLDILLTPGMRNMIALESNSFGDLLPGILDEQGRDTYRRELELYKTPPF